MSAFELRIIILLIGLLVLALIYYYGNKKPAHTRADIDGDELFQIEAEVNSPAAPEVKVEASGIFSLISNSAIPNSLILKRKALVSVRHCTNHNPTTDAYPVASQSLAR